MSTSLPRLGRSPIRDSWFYRACTEDRLRQIDAGIELGMTGRQIALAIGAHVGTLNDFASKHERHFPTPRDAVSRRAGKRVGAKNSASAAYFRGERVDLWRDGAQDRAPHDNTLEELVLE